MKFRDAERGIHQSERVSLERVILELEAEIQFSPGSQSRTTVDIDTLTQLLRAAKDGLAAQSLFDALEPAAQELQEIGRSHVSSSMGRATAGYLVLHPEFED